MKKALFILCVAACLTPYISAPAALALGIAVALAGLATFEAGAKQYSKLLIQVSIVLLGFSIELSTVVKAGVGGLGFAAGAIILVFALGALLQRTLKTDVRLSALLCAGTAICGGSAIAATSSVIGASSSAVAVATAVVFVLNAVGVYAYPAIGHALHLTQEQFGAWAAVGIHDVAGVVAAGKQYGPVALEQATVIKLTRVLWIVPVALVMGWWVNRLEPAPPHAAKPKAPIPWFIVWFLAASALRTFVPALAEPRVWLEWTPAALSSGAASLAESLRALGKVLLTVALFLIGTGLSRAALASVGWRPLLMGITLWLCVSAAALAAVMSLL